jgi:hypothetical protein
MKMPDAKKTGAVILISVCLMLPLILTGCGVKAFPKVPREPSLPEIKELKAEHAGDILELSWRISFSEKDHKEPEGFAVYRFRADAKADICENCPIPFERVARIPFSPDNGKKPVYYEKLLPGYRYLFKVTACGKDGSTGPDSETVSFSSPEN